MAPEILEGKEFNGSKADVFALGVVLFGITSGYLPFNKANYSDLFYRGLMG